MEKLILDKERLNRLYNAIENKIEEVGYEFWDDVNIVSYYYEEDDRYIKHPFYSECFRFEVEDPYVYYGMTEDDMEKFFEYYGV